MNVRLRHPGAVLVLGAFLAACSSDSGASPAPSSSGSPGAEGGSDPPPGGEPGTPGVPGTSDPGYQFPNLPIVPSTVSVTAVPTFEAIGLSWKATSGADGHDALVRYREVGTIPWKQALPMGWDSRTQSYGASENHNAEYRGSIFGLQSKRRYEVEAFVDGVGELARTEVSTWNEAFPVGTSIALPASSATQLNITQGGSASGYVLYAPAADAAATIDVANGADYDIDVQASYVIVRKITLKGARMHGIHLGRNVHDVVIEDCDISGWGRIESDGLGTDMDSGIASTMYGNSPDLKRVVIQRNRIHHPRSNSNNWRQPRAAFGGNAHPFGPQGISLWGVGGNNVIRYNEIYSDATHYFNDAIGAGNNFSFEGSPGPDTDIYGNKISHVWDDALEMEGGGRNVRIWGNYIDLVYNAIANSVVSVGPMYVVRNVVHRTQYAAPDSMSSGRFTKSQTKNVGGMVWGGGRVYLFHNTLFRASRTAGADEGISGVGTQLVNVRSANNILDTTWFPLANTAADPKSSSDYDLLTGREFRQGLGAEPHGIFAAPAYDPSHSSGPYTQSAGSPGHDKGVVIPNINDGFSGTAPDVGAQERDAPALEFGVP